MEHSSMCIYIELLKLNFVLKNILLMLILKHSCRLITKFRTCNKLAMEKGRYNNIERHRRHCDLCNDDIIGENQGNISGKQAGR